MASSTGTLVTLGAVAVGGYLLYNYLSTPVAAAAATTTTTPVTPTTGGTSTSTTSTSGTGTGGTSSTTGTGGGGGETQPAAPSLASIYTSILAGVRTDPNFTVSTGGALQANTPEGMIVGTPYRWAVYLNLALPTNIPSPSLSTVFPGVDLTQPLRSEERRVG